MNNPFLPKGLPAALLVAGRPAVGAISDTEPRMLEVELPYPPSVNHYWRHFRGRMVISRWGLRFRDQVRAILGCMNIRPLAGKLAISIEVFPPDRRRRDLDNLLKALGDSLEHGGAFHDDSQIVWLLIEKATVVRGGKVVVRIKERR